MKITKENYLQLIKDSKFILRYDFNHFSEETFLKRIDSIAFMLNCNDEKKLRWLTQDHIKKSETPFHIYCPYNLLYIFENMQEYNSNIDLNETVMVGNLYKISKISIFDNKLLISYDNFEFGVIKIDNL